MNNELKTQFSKRVTLVTVKSIANDEISFIEFQGHMKEKAVRQTLDKLLTYSYKIIGLSLIIRDYVTDNFTLEKETIKKTII